ncbi:hypothetical protein [Nonomuraea aridisoli]|uniref:hypothetical protein n=1 Tax=Nonomuraea aridisoli TaxID=2070368 RepID=UPI001C64FA28|nr:hypothetical protein [Nonomuraea aridisoli]
MPAAPLAGKTVIDTCNHGPERDGPIPELESKSLTSSELLLQHLPDAMVVKAFNDIFFKHLLSLAHERTPQPRWTCGGRLHDEHDVGITHQAGTASRSAAACRWLPRQGVDHHGVGVRDTRIPGQV